MYYHDTMDIDEAREYFNDRISEIKVTHDIDKAVMLSINEKLDELYNDVCTDFSFWKSRFEIIKGKIEQVEKGKCTVGSNTEFRRANAIKLAQRFPVDYFLNLEIPDDFEEDTYEGEYLNLYELRDQCTHWFNLFQTVLNAIDFKASRLIIIASALKIEGIVSR